MVVLLHKTFTSKHFFKQKAKSTYENALTNGTFMFYFGSVRGTDREALGNWVGGKWWWGWAWNMLIQSTTVWKFLNSWLPSNGLPLTASKANNKGVGALLWWLPLSQFWPGVSSIIKGHLKSPIKYIYQWQDVDDDKFLELCSRAIKLSYFIHLKSYLD